MLRWIIGKKLDRVERLLGVSIDYARHILRTSLPAFFRFSKIFSISSYRRRLPADAHAVATLVAARDEDCGTCVQIGINLAKEDGVPNEVLQAVIDERTHALPDALADVYRFTHATVVEKRDAPQLRSKVVEHYGEEALVELALAIASSRFYPVTKRVLGYATSCSRAKVEL